MYPFDTYKELVKNVELVIFKYLQENERYFINITFLKNAAEFRTENFRIFYDVNEYNGLKITIQSIDKIVSYRFNMIENLVFFTEKILKEMIEKLEEN